MIEIITSENDDFISFSKLSTGDVFVYNDNVYVKSILAGEHNAFNLKEIFAVRFTPMTKVRKARKATLRLEF